MSKSPWGEVQLGNKELHDEHSDKLSIWIGKVFGEDQ
jgi:hypothetical protein